MKDKKKIYGITGISIAAVTVLAYILITKTRLPWMLSRLAIRSVLLPVLIAEAEVYFCVEYFVFALRQNKIQTLLKGIGFLCGIGVLLLGVIGLIALLLELPWTEILFGFGAATILLGISRLIYSIWEIVRYKRNAPERKVIIILFLVGKLIFSLLVIFMGWWGMLIGSFIS